MGLPQAGQRIERSVAERRRLLEAHRGRLVRDARALLNADELGVCTEGEPGYAEDVFTDREFADSGADCDDLPGELAAEDPLSRPADAKDQPAEEGDRRAAAWVGIAGRRVQPVHRRGVDFAHYLPLATSRLIGLLETSTT